MTADELLATLDQAGVDIRPRAAIEVPPGSTEHLAVDGPEADG